MAAKRIATSNWQPGLEEFMHRSDGKIRENHGEKNVHQWIISIPHTRLRSLNECLLTVFISQKDIYQCIIIFSYFNAIKAAGYFNITDFVGIKLTIRSAKMEEVCSIIGAVLFVLNFITSVACAVIIVGPR